MQPLPPLIIIVGHYGVGKTNLALNLARIQRDSCQIKAAVLTQTIVDLDVVNPYFRTSDFARALVSFGIRLLGPSYGSTTLDTPSLMPGIDTVIAEANDAHPVIVDVGGDVDGARALARFAPYVTAQLDRMVIYVVNNARPEIADAQRAAAVLREIENISGVSATHIAGNTHLKEQTVPETIIRSLPYVHSVACAVDLPVVFVTAPPSCAAEVKAASAAGPYTFPILSIDVIVGNPWETLVPFGVL